jgi:hypothetical protein
MGVMAHPEVVMSVVRNPGNTTVGYAYRFLVLVPEIRIGGKVGPFARIDQRVADRYRRSVWSLLALPSFGDADGRTPNAVTLSPMANDAYWSFFRSMQTRILAGGDLHELHGWVEKMCMSVIRLAGVLHLAEHAPSEGQDAYDIPVSELTMQRAVAVGEFLVPHARVAFGVPERPRPAVGGGSLAVTAPVVSLIDAVVALVDGCEGRTWRGTSNALLTALNASVPVLQRESGWPRSAAALSKRLATLDAALRLRGLFLDPHRSAASRDIVIFRP